MIFCVTNIPETFTLPLKVPVFALRLATLEIFRLESTIIVFATSIPFLTLNVRFIVAIEMIS